ncbi:hypothetical protein Droror1_Dr00005773 [Drosera rotundifolia]
MPQLCALPHSIANPFSTAVAVIISSSSSSPRRRRRHLPAAIVISPPQSHPVALVGSFRFELSGL